MEVFELILMLMLAVLLSSILDQVVPRISSPLIQIALGIGIALLAIAPIEVNLDPELFLVLFIAPLLFNDALEADKKNLWDNKATIVSFAIGLVVVITLCVGFVLHWLVPSIPLAAAFALGAALGPTDAVAVQALKKEAKVGKREGAILQGEALINDASGVVSFQFAVSAAVTGAFSLADAATSFAVDFVGGIILGILLACLFLFVNRRIHDLGLDNITFHVLFEVSMPLVVYLFSELVGVSGILAVVACGIVWSMFRDRKISPYQSRLNIALTSVWKVIGFVLNGVVFVLLGIQLPGAMQSTWDNLYINNFVLIGYVLLLTAVIVLLRFAWALVMTRLVKNPSTGKRDKFSLRMVKNALVTTVGGPKGAITLSIAFTIPFLLADGSSFPQRSLIIFLASGVIVCTLLLANFLLPVLAPKVSQEPDEDEVEELMRTKIEIMRTVIERLMADSTDENDRETKIVVSSYNNRIRHIRSVADIEEPAVAKLRIEVLDYQVEQLIAAIERREIDPYSGFEYLQRLTRQKNLIAHSKEKATYATSFRMARIRTAFTVAFRSVKSTFVPMGAEDQEAMDKVRERAEQYAVEYLQKLVNNPDYPSEVVAKLLINHERALSVFDRSDATMTSEAVENATVSIDDIQRHGLQYELEVIQDFYASGNLTRAQAKDMRDNVSLMLLDLEEHV